MPEALVLSKRTSWSHGGVRGKSLVAQLRCPNVREWGADVPAPARLLRSPSLSLPSAPLPTFLPNQIHLMRQRDSPTRLAFHLGASCAKWMVLPLPPPSTLPTVVGGVPPLSSFSLMGRNWGTKALWKRERGGRAEGELKVTRR